MTPQKTFKRSFVSAEAKCRRAFMARVTKDDINRAIDLLMLDMRSTDRELAHSAMKIAFPYLFGPAGKQYETMLEENESTAPKFDFSRVPPGELRSIIETINLARVPDDMEVA